MDYFYRFFGFEINFKKFLMICMGRKEIWVKRVGDKLGC